MTNFSINILINQRLIDYRISGEWMNVLFYADGIIARY